MVKMQAVLYAQLCKLMMEYPVTYHDIVDETGLSIVTVREYCKELHRKKCIHVHSWIILPLSKTRTPVFIWGAGRDATRPPPIPASQRQIECRKRKNQRLLAKSMDAMTRYPQ